jgi:hypothetical protein
MVTNCSKEMPPSRSKYVRKELLKTILPEKLPTLNIIMNKSDKLHSLSLKDIKDFPLGKSRNKKV